MTLPVLREHTDAVVAKLETHGGFAVGDADGEELTPPYAVVYPIPGGGYSGTLANPKKNVELVRQVTCVGITREQSEWVCDEVMALLDGLQVESRLICRIHPDSSPGTFIDRDVSPPVFVTPVRFRITSTPS